MTSYVFWIAWRNLKTKRSRRGLSFMTSVSIIGVAIGVAALIIVLSVMGGFENDLREKMLSGQPNMELVNRKNAVLGMSLQEYPLDELKKKAGTEFVSFEPFCRAEIVLKQSKHMTSASIIGIRPEMDSKLWAFNGTIIEGELSSIGRKNQDIFNEQQLPGIVLGESLAIQLGAQLGEVIEVISPNANFEDALGGGTVIRRYVLSGIFRSGVMNYDSKLAVVSLSEGRKYLPEYDESLDEEEVVTGFAMSLKDPYKVDQVAEQIVQKFPGLLPVTWKQMNESLLFALMLEKMTMSLILSLVVLVAAFSISGTMMMTVFYKKPQVSLLRALGVSKKSIMRIYLLHGNFIGLVGIFLGLIIGLGVCSFIRYVGHVALPEGVYYLRSLPVKFLPEEYVLICLGAFLFSLLASVYPAYIAARQTPAQGLRFN